MPTSDKALVIVVHFPGTGVIYNRKARGYISQEMMELADHEEIKNNNYEDQNFHFLHESLSDDQLIYGFDGCDNHGGSRFAYGVEGPANYIIQQLQDLIKSTQKIKLILGGQSRGCCSAMYVALKISEDKDLADKVDVIMDLRDPVPGNLELTAQYGIADKLRNLKECMCIKEVHITVQAYSLWADSVLIPEFPTNAKLIVEYLPGSHMCQTWYSDLDILKQKDIPGTSIEQLPEKNHVVSRYVFLLGFYNSLQIYFEHAVKINYQSVIDRVMYFHRTELKLLEAIISQYKDTKIISYCIGSQDAIQVHNAILENFRKLKQLTEDEVLNLIIENQKIIYNGLLHFYQKNKEEKHLTKIDQRRVRFTPVGEFKITHQPNNSTHFNLKHASLSRLEQKPRIMLGFYGERDDLLMQHQLEKIQNESNNNSPTSPGKMEDPSTMPQPENKSSQTTPGPVLKPASETEVKINSLKSNLSTKLAQLLEEIKNLFTLIKNDKIEVGDTIVNMAENSRTSTVASKASDDYFYVAEKTAPLYKLFFQKMLQWVESTIKFNELAKKLEISQQDLDKQKEEWEQLVEALSNPEKRINIELKFNGPEPRIRTICQYAINVKEHEHYIGYFDAFVSSSSSEEMLDNDKNYFLPRNTKLEHKIFDKNGKKNESYTNSFKFG